SLPVSVRRDLSRRARDLFLSNDVARDLPRFRLPRGLSLTRRDARGVLLPHAALDARRPSSSAPPLPAPRSRPPFLRRRLPAIAGRCGRVVGPPAGGYLARCLGVAAPAPDGARGSPGEECRDPGRPRGRRAFLRSGGHGTGPRESDDGLPNVSRSAERTGPALHAVPATRLAPAAR